MEEEFLLKQALDFFGFHSNQFTSQQLRTKYRELALRYHPDAGEFSSEVLFQELVRARETLEQYLETSNPTQEGSAHSQLSSRQESNTSPKNDDFSRYRSAKKRENDLILNYFGKTEGNPIFLSESDNPELRHLKVELRFVLAWYESILKDYPRTLFRSDIEKSIEKIRVWLKD